MHGGQHDPFGAGARRLGQRLAPAVIGVVVALAPIQRHDHDRLAGPEQHEALGEQRVHDLLGVRHTAAHAGVADGNGDIRLEGGHAERASRGKRDNASRQHQGQAQHLSRSYVRSTFMPGYRYIFRLPSAMLSSCSSFLRRVNLN